ncbi:hypothetical protein [Thalassomonas actiniarum]|uniref:Secreted protein n=1 Tax=Thalassomonas actiniarum TaxID=485447 RepID=A0AAF0C419_9GAMM|nr:hypothetical protein [Thalassomonas actiniarum]WDD99550.1 hypothetical protein SG35_002410 [Thalassomonas actiniarum]
MKNTSAYFLLLLFLLSLSVSQDLQAKKACKKYLEKLHQVQAKQRNGNSLKQSNKLKEKETKARDNWWACENGKLAKKKKKSKKRQQKKTEKIVRLTPEKNKTTTKAKKAPVTPAPFATQRAIVLKAEYQGQQQLDWLAFYKQPDKCQQPKNIKVFAACVEDKRLQQQLFEQHYQK